jgi:hypothetical protein
MKEKIVSATKPKFESKIPKLSASKIMNTSK